ncbi:zinc-binding dehydrogenase domain-containing [Trichoderma arundinaceum]|uniref:Zinc-binding dehydrogenase domain-containing n=1 Tax=Trichoderma arundinaceum TaxID=490622 RepID=A0A395NBY9_TRIAR|nr:zinc-binding dehydrogenase domain-containing [Trichoderma arundinaceum]
MQAWHHHPPGGTEKLKIVQVNIPEIDNDEVLVKVHAAGLIWMELYWQLYEKEDGTYKTPIPGEDYSGVIVEVGSKVPKDRGLKVGTEVMVFVTKAFSSKRSTDGGMAEYAKAHFSRMIHKPQSLSHVEAASVPLSALTAWQGLFDHAKLRAGQTLLVAGGTGPTAIWAIQMGKMVGARVIATAASEQSFKLLNSLSVDQVINYKEVKLESALENIDVVFNAVGDETTKQALKVVTNDGIIVNIVDTTVGDLSKESVRDSFREPFFRKEDGRTVVFFIVDINVEQLTKIGNLLDEGKLKAVIGAVFEFNDVVSAFKQGEMGHAHGKIVVKGPGL